MLKLIGGCIKATLFTAAVLVLGNWVRVGDRTVSEQVREGMERAGSSEVAAKVKSAAESLAEQARSAVQDAKKGSARKPTQTRQPPSRQEAKAQTESQPPSTSEQAAPARNTANAKPLLQQGENIPSTEREKLKALIEKLNKSQRERISASASQPHPPAQPANPN